MYKALLLFILLPFVLLGQNSQLPDPVKDNRDRRCKKYTYRYKRLPIELRYYVHIEGRNIIFSFGSKDEFDKLFNRKFDGLVVDIIKREQFGCNTENIITSEKYKGHLLTPVFKKELKRKLVVSPVKGIRINLGELPKDFDADNVECNLLILQRKNICDYHSFAYLKYNHWGLLKMGLYRDTISTTGETRHLEFSKLLTFEIPFRKNQPVFKKEDIQPLYDSLRLTEYKIKTINIEAFTSVEGTLSNNITLQNERAESIVTALQSYQKPEIEFEINARENWYEFHQGIKNTPFDYLNNMTKENIKQELRAIYNVQFIDSLLSTHRKAKITMRLERKVPVNEESKENLIRFFNQSIERKDIEASIYIQEVIFDKIKNNILPKDLIGQLSIPNSSVYSPVINNGIIFKYEQSTGSIYDHIRAFKNLLTIIPDNPQVKYNLIALKIKAWAYDQSFITPKELKKDMGELAKLGISSELRLRLKVNFNIILTQYMEIAQEFKLKRRALRQVYDSYRHMKLSDKDLLILAKYLSIYSQFKWAEHVLEKRVYDADASSALRDYYFRLTLTNKRKINSAKYKELIKRQIQQDRTKFCQLFLPNSQQGLSFQILALDWLKEMYCESCGSL